MRSVLLGLITQLRASPGDDTFFFSQASPGEKFCFNLPTQDPNAFYNLQNVQNQDIVALTDCKLVQNEFMGDSLEPAPLSWSNNLPKAIECTIPDTARVGDEFVLSWAEEDGEMLSHDTIEIVDRNGIFQLPEEEGLTCWRRKSIRKQERARALAAGRADGGRKRRSSHPSIDSLIPRQASPNGGTIITIVGQNLKSKIIDIGGQTSESEDQGETFEIWFGRDWDDGNGETKIPCRIDRMLGLHLENMSGVDTVSCVVDKIMRPGHYWIRMIIDNNDKIIYGTHVYFAESAAPSISLHHPSASSPAKASDANDYEGAYWTGWYDVDTDNDDGVQDESLNKHWESNANEMQWCINPLDIEVINKRTGLPFVNSKNENADDYAIATYSDTLQGFKCEDASQTIDTIKCPDVKVRYRCLPGLREFKGRIYTDVHGRSDHPEFHINRIMETPKIVNENDGFKATAQIFLNDGENCGDHPNCGVNKRLPMKVTSGDNGIIRYVGDISIPGGYNFTYQVFHNGFSMTHKRNLNYMTNEDLIPVTYEVYPQIDNINPQMGSIEGGTLVTITGSGFVEDGMGGSVNVKLGEDDCDIVSMSEREIICRTAAKAEEPPCFAESRVFTPFTGLGHATNGIINKWDDAGSAYGFTVKNAAHCEDLCRIDASCIMFVFHDDNCYHHNLATQSVDATYHTDHYQLDGWEGAVGGYIAWDSRSDETDCFSGRGEKYVGSVAVTKHGNACKSGTFCRNPNPLEQTKPYCETEDGSHEACNILYCSNMLGKYSGNRGSDVKVQKAYRFRRELDEVDYPEARYSAPGWSWTNENMAYSFFKFYGTFFGNKGENYRLRAKNYFIAPFDGVFSFHLRGDDAHDLSIVNDDGSFESIARSTWWACHVDDDCEVPSDFTRQFTFVKGDKIKLIVSYTENTGNDHATVGVHYHGKTETSGTWHDTVPRNEWQQDQYTYDRQELYLRQTGKKDDFWLFFNHMEGVQDGSAIPDGEEWDSSRDPEFKIKWCGDNNNCFEADIDPKLPSWGDKMEDTMNEWLNTECSTSGTMNPLRYYSGFEKDQKNDWPGSHHFVRFRNSYCGRMVHETHNHDFWNTNLGGAFNTDNENDVCFAYEGIIDSFKVYAEFKYLDSEGNEKTFKDWMTVPVNWQSKGTYRHHCFKIKDTIAPGDYYDGSQVTSGLKVYNMRVENSNGANIYIDELRVGKMRSTITVTQTRKALSFGGQVPNKFDLGHSSSHWWGRYIHLEVETWAEGAFCGTSPPLPQIFPGTKNGIVHEGPSTGSSGSDYTTLNPPMEIIHWPDFASTYTYDVQTKDYYKIDLDYKNILVSPVKRSKFHVWVFRRNEKPTSLENVPVSITLEGSPETLNVNLGYDYWPKHLLNDLIATWPQLGEQGLNIQTWRSGWCNEGYKYVIKTQQHGNMPSLTMTANPAAGFYLNPKFEAIWHHHSSVPTDIVPGSVIATHHHLPQVVVTANGQRSACRNCDYRFSERYTPVLNSVTPSSGAITMGDAIVFEVNVKDYTGDLTEFSATVGGVEVNSCTSTEVDNAGDRVLTVSCLIGATGEGSNHEIVVQINDMGVMSASSTLTVSTVVTDNSPKEGSRHGGTIVTAQGTGFAPNQIISVDFNGESVNCDSTGLDVTYTEMKCRTAANGGSSATSPQLDSVTPNKLTVVGGERITLTGSDFSSNCDGSVVYIGDAAARTISWTDSEIIAVAPAQEHKNSRAVRVYVCNLGESNSINVNTRFQVTGVSSTFSSLAGGNMITVSGSGFASMAETSGEGSLWAAVGSYPCEISDVTYSSFVCKTAPYNNRVELQVTGNGIYRNGVKVDEVEIEKGTEVMWRWRIAISGVVPFVRLQRTSAAGDATTSNGQYWSPEFQGDEGKFVMFFTGKGTYHYSTGLIDSATIFSSSTIKVVDPTDKPMQFSVQMNGFHASISNFNTAQPSHSCETIGTSTAMPPAEAGPWITYSWATTPVINIQNNLVANTLGDVNRVYFAQNAPDMNSCNGRVTAYYGSYAGNYDSHGNNWYKWIIDPAGEMDTAGSYELRVNLENIGDAYYTDYVVESDDNDVVTSYQVGGNTAATFGAHVDSINIDRFSRNGDVDLVISGQGFVSTMRGDDNISIRGDFSVNCKSTSQSYTEVSCRLDKISQNEADFDFEIYVDEFNTGFNVYTRTGSTPSVNNADRTTVGASSNEITFSGANLDGLVVYAGDFEATVSGGGNSATATFSGVQGGRYPLRFHATSGGVTVADGLDQITVEYSASGISPSSGGLNGGSLVTVTGYGFDKDSVVEMYASNGERLCEFCRIKEVVDTSTLVFYSARVTAADTAKVVVKHEYLSSDTEYSFDFVYSASSGSVNSASGSTSGMVGGESISLAVSNEGSCENMAVEIVQTSDPCAVGAHECADSASCHPTADGLDYTCSCDPCEHCSDGDYWHYYGSGRDCFEFVRRGTVADAAEAATKCESQYGESIYRVESQYDEDQLKAVFQSGAEGSDGTASRGAFAMFYGEIKCFRGEIDQNGDFGFVFPEGDCQSWGSSSESFKKRVYCRRYHNRNCFDNNMDNGRYTYKGWLSQTLTGKQCSSWEPTQWFDDYNYNPHYLSKGNLCRNLWDSDNGVFCPNEEQWDWKNPERFVTESCGIPTCEELNAGAKRFACAIRPYLSALPDEYLYSYGEDPDYIKNDTFVRDKNCYIGGRNDNRLHNPHRCYYDSRFPDQWRINTVSPGVNTVELVRTDGTSRYLAVDMAASSDSYRIKIVQDANDPNAQLSVVDDVFAPGTVSIRKGEYFVHSGRGSTWMKPVHQNELDTIEDVQELAWVLECPNDDLGNLIDQPKTPFMIKETVTPSCSAGVVTFDAPSLPAGSYKAVLRSSEYGQAENVIDLDYALNLDSVVPAEIGTNGGQLLTLSGSGFSEMTTGALCGEELTFVSFTAASGSDAEELVFLAPAIDPANCGGLVIESVDGSDGSAISSDSRRKRRQIFNEVSVTEDANPTITMVEPKIGGTMGGTSITITGTNFGSTTDGVTVTFFEEVACDVQSVTDTQIVCVTNAFPRGREQVATAPVVFIPGGAGTATNAAVNEKDTKFWYMDRWSSPYTWGCTDDSCKPQAGEIIVVPAGQVLLLDETTPLLAVLIVDGGTLIWDRSDGIELHMQYGVVNNGGHFEIGNEDEPFCEGNALIKLYGHQRSINLPIYGAKVLAIRFGTISIFGCPKTTTWTELAETVEEGDTQITLTHPIGDDWFVGNDIVIAATGDLTNFHRSEKRQIAAVSADGYTVTLTEALEHRHIAVCSNGPDDNGSGWGWAGEICTRAEVGLLTRNVKMMGNINNDWTEELPECKLGPGTAFGGQTCFQNRYGHETGSDQFGSVLFLHKPSFAHIAFFEVTHAGQAFNLARYPIHFHTPGSMVGSYVRGCAIHNTFNRALTLHGIHDIVVEHNVIFNVMGLAFFLEDAVEENNILRYNLGIMNKKSSSLLNVDSTPSVFWITNPNNIFYGNRVAGSSHFGYWFNPPEDGPTGPSSKDPQYDWVCPKNRPLGQFYNNTAHSLGKYGMWIFVDLTPTQSGECGDGIPKANKFGWKPEIDVEGNEVPEDTFGFFAWHCERGAEIATGGALQFHNMIVANNWIAGLAGKESFLHTYADGENDDQAQLFKHNIVIGHLSGDPELDACGDMGIETPWKFFSFTVDDIHFFNFDEPTPELSSIGDPANFGMAKDLAPRRCVAFDPCYGSNAFDCGAITWFRNTKWYNSQRRSTFAWEGEAGVLDLDGSFAGGSAGDYVIAASDAFDPALCSLDTSEKYDNANTDPSENTRSHPAMRCKGSLGDKKFKPHRFMFNNAKPDSAEGTMAVFTNQYGTTKSGFRNCRPRGKGWMVMLQGNEEYEMHFETLEHVSNISYTGDIDDLEQGEWITIRHDFPELIDFAEMKGAADAEPEKVEEWPEDPLTLNTYDYNVQNETAPFTVRYTFNGQANTENPQVQEGAYTWGEDFYVEPAFHKCFFKDCIPPPPAPPTLPPALVDCNFLDCVGGELPAEFSDIHVAAGQNAIIDSAAIAAAGSHFKFGSVFVDGTLVLPGSSLEAGATVSIDCDHLVINTGQGENKDNLSNRRRRDIVHIANGNIIIGTADDPIPCGTKVVLKINGDEYSPSFGAMPGSVPIGAKALGGIGGIEMHGCELANTWTTLTNTVRQGDSQITVDTDVSAEWKVGDELAIATSDYEQRHTEYVSITAISGMEITLNTTLEWTHLGSADSTIEARGRTVSQAAEVALLTRNIVIDGSGGAEGKMGGRILVTNYMETNGVHTYYRNGYGQFSFVEFKGMGQFGYSEYDDLRAAILFYNVDGDGDADNGLKNSYVKGCAFHAGFHSAIAVMFESDNIEVSNNVIFGTVDSAIITDSNGLTIDGNVIGNVFHPVLYQDYFETTVNANFPDDKTPSGIETMGTQDVLITNNRVSGVDGSCFGGNGELCNELEAATGDHVPGSWTGNHGKGCVRGYYILWGGHSACTKVSGFTFHKTLFYGITAQTSSAHLVIDDVIIQDAPVGIYAIMTGPDATMHSAMNKDVTIKNSYIVGRSDSYDCSYDTDVKANVYSAPFMARQSSKVQVKEAHTALQPSDFIIKSNGFPACEWWANEIEPALYGNTLIYSTEFVNFNGKCGDKDSLSISNKKMSDHVFPITYVSNNVKTNVNDDYIAINRRPQLKTVNIADCVDLFCDGYKFNMVVDKDGSIFGEAGSLIAESEYEWDGFTRVQPDGSSLEYVQTQDGLGDYRIPKPMETRMDGSRIPINEVRSDVGAVRSDNCVWKKNFPGWFCPDIEYQDLVYESMDEDHMRRRLSPVAIRSEGYVTIANGPGDHSCCIGYACFVRLSTFHLPAACGKEFDVYLSSTTPMTSRWHLPNAPADCKIKVSFYTKRPNRIDIVQDGQYMVPTNGDVNDDGSIAWQKPDIVEHMVGVDSHQPGANFQDRDNQMFHFILAGGKVYDMTTVQTLVLELGVMTELTDDEFYDNGNLANNLAALLGIDPSKIRVMNVIREDSRRRRKRREEGGFLGFSLAGFRFRREGAGSTLQIEISPEETESGAAKLSDLAEEVVAKAADVASTIADATGAEIEADIAVARPPPLPETPPPAVPLTELLGMREITPEDDVEAFLAEVEKTLGSPLSELKTAEQAANEAQELVDAANEAIVYDTPTRMEFSHQPMGPQILDQKFFDVFSVIMYDQNDEVMTTVGFVDNPVKLKAEVVDAVVTGPNVASPDGTTRVEFTPGSGVATFDNLILTGDVTSAKIKFSIASPAEYVGTVDPIISDVITFIPPQPEGECVADEGNPFDKKESWTGTCDFVCLSPCSDLSDLGGAVGGPECMDVAMCEGTGDMPTYSTCDADVGCKCNMTEVPPQTEINPEDFVTAECSSGSLEVRINKCVMNRFGFTLSDLYINGPEVTDDFSALATSASNNCRGKIGYASGAEYVFSIDRNFGDCGTVIEANGTHNTYSNAIQGSAGIDNGVIKRMRNLFTSFTCVYEIDISVSIGIGAVQATSLEIALGEHTGTFDVTMAPYTDSSFSVVAENSSTVTIPEDVYIGLSLADASAEFVTYAKDCWVTATDNPEDTDMFDLVVDGCVNPDDPDNIAIIENGATAQSRFSFAAFQFVGLESNQLYAHCAVQICTADNMADCTPSCASRRRRSPRERRSAADVVTMSIPISFVECNRNCDAGDVICRAPCAEQAKIFRG